MAPVPRFRRRAFLPSSVTHSLGRIALCYLWGLILAQHAVGGTDTGRVARCLNCLTGGSSSTGQREAGGTLRGRQLYGSLKRQSGPGSHFHPVPGHRHLLELQSRAERRWRPDGDRSPGDGFLSSSTSSLSHTLRVGLAGGIAGAIGTATLYPFDSAKTLRQSDPSRYKSVGDALWELCRPTATAASSPSANTLTRHSRLGGGGSAPSAAVAAFWRRVPGARAYNGLLASTLGAIPSSALYFGAYESMKRIIRSASGVNDEAADASFASRLLVHAAAAASGNVISSAVFVPKELIKQRMQYAGTSVGATVWSVVSDHGVRGLYRGYQATLMRNIPSAALRFVLYEELKRAWHPPPQSFGDEVSAAPAPATNFSWRLFAAGAVAGALASGFMTPVDVLKTRLSTGTCPVDVPGCFWHVLKEQGWSGLYAGAGSRMAFSGAFSAIGFASFEAAKTWLGVTDQGSQSSSSVGRALRPQRPRRVMTHKQTRLERVLEENYEERP